MLGGVPPRHGHRIMFAHGGCMVSYLWNSSCPVTAACAPCLFTCVPLPLHHVGAANVTNMCAHHIVISPPFNYVYTPTPTISAAPSAHGNQPCRETLASQQKITQLSCFDSSSRQKETAAGQACATFADPKQTTDSYHTACTCTKPQIHPGQTPKIRPNISRYLAGNVPARLAHVQLVLVL
jgi:hypothetical protein